MAKLAYDMSIADQQIAMAHHKTNYEIDLADEKMFCRPEWKKNFHLAMDAQPQLVTTPSSGIPAYLTYFTDPDILRVLTAKNKAVEIFGEKQKGDWLSESLFFPVVEHTYEVSSYGDFNNNGMAGINTNFPQRQPYNFQTIVTYGEREIEKVGLAKIGFVAEQKQAAITGLNKLSNLSYFYGIKGLQNYGALNDPNLFAYISPVPKANGGVAWLNGTAPNASANEIYNDIQALVFQLINQSSGQIDQDSKLILALSPKSKGALTATNSFNVNVSALLKENFPNLEIKSAIQYGVLTPQNPQGSAAGEVVQLYCPDVDGQESGYMSFNTKLRSGPVVRDLTSFRQKMWQGTNGFILRQPFSISQLIGV